VKRRVLTLRRRRCAEHLARRRLVEARLDAGVADRLQQPHRALPGDVARVLRHVERDAHVRLRTEVVDLVGLQLVEHAHEPRGIRQVGMVQEQLDLLGVRVAVQVVDALGVEGRRAAHEPVHLVALLEQLLGEEGAVLSGDAGDEGAWHGATC